MPTATATLVIPNRIALACKVCGDPVPIGRGYAAKEEGGWATYHAEHLPHPIPLTPEQMEKKRAEDAERALRWDGGEPHLDPASHVAANGFRPFPYQVSGAAWLRGRRRALLADDQGVGKALAHGTLTLAPDGWRPIESLAVGDALVDPATGGACAVRGVYPQGVRPALRVTFSDGASAACDPDHLWVVNTPTRRSRRQPSLVLTTREIMDRGVRDAAGNRKWFLPLTAPAVHAEAKLPIDPYLLGYLLGNGAFTGSSPEVTIPEEETAALLATLMPAGVFLRRHPDRPIQYRMTSDDEGECANPLLDALERLKLWGHKAEKKHVPRRYLLGSIGQRERMLRGLMDSDGCPSNNVLDFSSSSERLVEGIIYLARSLGGVATHTVHPESYVNPKGERVACLDRHRSNLALPEGVAPFELSSKAARYLGRTRPPFRAIESIEPCGEAEMTCIAVDSADRTFLIDDFVVTHNTVQALLALPEGDSCRALAVVPASVKLNWAKECERWRPDLEARVLEGTRNDPAAFVPGPGEFVVCNYDILPKEGSSPRLTPGSVVICDEAQALKNYKTSRHKRLKALVKDDVRAWLLTGTPMLNRPPDLLGVLQAGGMDRAVFGSFSRFKALMGGRDGRFGLEWTGRVAPEVPSLLRRAMLRRLKSEVLADLPPKRFQEIVVDGLPRDLKAELDRQWDAYNEFLKRNPDGELPPFEMFSGTRAKVAEAKTVVACQWIEDYLASQDGVEDPRPLVVMSAHKGPVRDIAAKFGFATITGDTPNHDRQRIVDEFQAGRLPGVACTIQAAGVGLTLTRADTMLFVDLDWTPANNRQAQDRIHRVGSDSDRCLYVSIVAGHVLERHLHKLLAGKQEQQFAAIDAEGAEVAVATGEDVRSETDEQFAARLAEVERAIRAREEREERERAERERGRLEALALAEQAAAEVRERIERQRIERAKERAAAILQRERRKAADAGAKAPRLSAARAEATRQAVRYLASVCDGAVERDGQGFSKPDSCLGHILSTAGLEDGSDALMAAFLIVRRYPAQVKGRWPELWA